MSRRDKGPDLDSSRNYNNRELSWLAFNYRVLGEAESPSVPLLERIRFLAIVSSNLDEFFMVRVAQARRQVDIPVPPGPDGLSPRQVLRAIARKAQEMVRRQYSCLREDLLPRLRRAGITFIKPGDARPEEQDYLRQFFLEHVFPVLTPLAVDNAHPFPLLAGGAIYALLQTRAHAATADELMAEARTVLVQIPGGMKRFIPLRGGDDTRVVLLDDLVMHFAGEVVRGYEVTGACLLRITRDAEIDVDEDNTDDLLAALEEQLLSRRRGSPIRLEIEANTEDATIAALREQFGLAEDEVYRVPWMLNLRSLFSFPELLDRPDLCYPVWPPQPHPLLAGDHDIFARIRERDILLHHPYQSFDPVIELLARAAADPQVLAIKITLYRISGDSPLIAALARAAINGKQVTALVELRARFDEEANISWARRLDAAGVHVIYGVVGYKTHSKVLLVVRREPDGIRRYLHLATGNYNDRTALAYTDLGMFTARPEFGSDISAFFNVITGYSLPPRWQRIAMAPTGLRERVIGLIEREVENHTAETPGLIRAKMNSLIDPAVIKALYRASRAGVRIELVVRGMCRLRAGVKGLSENIRVVSILDRFLEHSRIYHFHNGGQDDIYLASADWMERNFDKRLELMFPVLDADCRRQVLAVLDAALADNTKAWELGPDGSYRRVTRRPRRRVFRSQEQLYQAAATLLGTGRNPDNLLLQPIEH